MSSDAYDLALRGDYASVHARLQLDPSLLTKTDSVIMF